jgi:hypothetical protein
MKLEVTRDVISDLWPLCQSGDASGDSRALVGVFLGEDPEFARTLRASEALPPVVPHVRLSPDAERRFLDEVAGRARTKLLLIAVAIATAGLVVLGLAGGALFLFFNR